MWWLRLIINSTFNTRCLPLRYWYTANALRMGLFYYYSQKRLCLPYNFGYLYTANIRAFRPVFTSPHVLGKSVHKGLSDTIAQGK